MKAMDENFVVCPFNKAHVIHRLRIQYHLVKCKRNYPNSRKIVCPYDATEYIDPDNFMQHLSQCKKNRKLDVTEEYKRKEFESIQHGCINNHPFHMPPHVEVTDEWDIASTESSNSGDSEMSRDELNAFRIRRESSFAVRKACNFIPIVPHPIGRGQANEAMREYLNRYKPPLNPVDPNAPILSADVNENEIYEDAVEDDSEPSDLSCDNNTSTNGNHNLIIRAPDDVNQGDVINQVVNYSSKYYIPSTTRGGHFGRSVMGRGVHIASMGRGVNFKKTNSNAFTSESFDDALKQIVNDLCENVTVTDIKYEERVGASSKSDADRIPCAADKLHTENEKNSSLTSSDILISNPHRPANVSLDKEKHSQSNLSKPSSINTSNKKINDSSSFISESFDDVLKQIVDGLCEKVTVTDGNCKDRVTASSESCAVKVPSAADKLRAENEKRFALTSSDILKSSPSRSAKHSLDKQNHSQSESFEPPTMNSSVSSNKAGKSEVPELSDNSVFSNSTNCETRLQSTDRQSVDFKNVNEESVKLTSPHSSQAVGRGQYLKSLGF